MRIITLVLTLLIGSAFALPVVAAQDLKPWQKRVLTLVVKEQKVLNAWWRDPVTNQLYVAIKPDGTRRDGYAQYLCLLLNQNGAPKGDLKTIWLHDPVTFDGYKNHTSSGSPIGMAACR